VLQEKEFTPLGETQPKPFDIQIVSASSISLNDAVNSGNFCSDLRFRLDIMPINLPPLRERKEDIIPLLEHFLEKEMINQNVLINDVDSEVLHFLISYTWPGNIRELVNMCIYLVAVAQAYEHKISMACLSDTMLKPSTSNEPIQESLQEGFIERRSAANNAASTVPAVEKVNTQLITADMIQQALSNSNGNKSLAAKELGISRMTLYRKIQESQESKDSN
jgi:transcriptional regulator with PAS, ATPase and Fis domain